MASRSNGRHGQAHPLGRPFLDTPMVAILFGRIFISCRDAQDGLLLLLRGDALHVDDVRALHEHGGRLSRDCQPHGVWPLPYDDERHVRDVRLF